MKEPRRYEELRKALIEEREELQLRIEEERGKTSISDDLDNPDITELASDYDIQQRASGTAEIFQLRLVEIEQAIMRLEEGTYGLCSNCGEEISTERLKLDPLTKDCSDCEEFSVSHDAPVQPADVPS